jgi:hypothetical protein
MGKIDLSWDVIKLFFKEYFYKNVHANSKVIIIFDCYIYLITVGY